MVRSRERRAFLAVLLGCAVAAVVTTVFVLDGQVAAQRQGLIIAASVGEPELPDCAELYPEWIQSWVDEEVPDIRSVYGEQEDAVTAGWIAPENFPAAAFGWAGAVPDCGTMLLVLSTGELWNARLDLESIDKVQFDAIATTLAAMGYRLAYDQVPHELLSVEGVPLPTGDESDAQSGETGGSTAWFRELSSATGTVSLTFFPDDPGAVNPVGELVIGYFEPLD